MFEDKIDGRVIRPSIDSRGYVLKYHLPDLEPKMFVAKKDINYLEKIIQYWIDQTSVPTNYISALKALVIAEEKKRKTSLELKQAQPAIEFTNIVTKSAESLRIGDYAKLLSDSVGTKIGSNKLMTYFRESGYLMKGRDSLEKNKPYQTSIDKGLFEFKIERPQPHIIVSVTYITGKGQFDLKEEVLMHFA